MAADIPPPPPALTGQPTTTPVTDPLGQPAQVDPFSVAYHDHPDIVSAMRNMWTKQNNGDARSESTMIIRGRDVKGNPITRFPKDTQDYSKERFDLLPGDKAIIHTHPNVMDGMPSKADRDIADKNKLDMYTVSKDGLYLYRTGMKQPELVKKGTDWLNPPNVCVPNAKKVCIGPDGPIYAK